ncbi:MAG: Trans-hexaprenyltranstransferase [Deltaproteobacteria bacterium]|nr:Trans-hexaprenyltranstransferase [Deltaproteobacteria bacterium]
MPPRQRATTPLHHPASILSQVEDDLKRIEGEIEKNLSSSVPLIAHISRHIIRSGGKRLRPLLMVLAARLTGYQGENHYPLSIVFEYLHAATLLHDDVVDSAEVRRNKPAANTIWGNPAAVLVGDFLLATSFALAVSSGHLKILSVLSETTTRMAEGEILQLINSHNLEISEQEYIEVITRKTAILIAASCQIGAIFGGADHKREEAMRSFGLNLGISFQLRDDVLDYTGSEEEVGKPIGQDLGERKITLPLIYTLATSNRKDRQRLVTLITADEITRETFTEVNRFIEHYRGIEYTSRLAERHITLAKEALTTFAPSATWEILAAIADYVVTRRV